MKSGSTTQDGTTVTCQGTYITQKDFFLQDWDSSSPWTKTIVNALKLGPLVVT